MTGFIILAVLAFGLCCIVKWLNKHVAPRIIRYQRDQRIETAIRYGMYDDEAAERIARQIEEEQRR